MREEEKERGRGRDSKSLSVPLNYSNCWAQASCQDLGIPLAQQQKPPYRTCTSTHTDTHTHTHDSATGLPWNLSSLLILSSPPHLHTELTHLSRFLSSLYQHSSTLRALSYSSTPPPLLPSQQTLLLPLPNHSSPPPLRSSDWIKSTFHYPCGRYGT